MISIAIYTVDPNSTSMVHTSLQQLQPKKNKKSRLLNTAQLIKPQFHRDVMFPCRESKSAVCCLAEIPIFTFDYAIQVPATHIRRSCRRLMSGIIQCKLFFCGLYQLQTVLHPNFVYGHVAYSFLRANQICFALLRFPV